MNRKIIVTNLRINEDDWLQIKAMAVEFGMSANEYINFISRQAISKAFLDKAKTPKKGKKRKDIYDSLLSLSQKKYKSKPMGSSEEDKIIYGV